MNYFEENINNFFNIDNIVEKTNNDNYHMFWEKSANELKNKGYEQLSYKDIIEKIKSSNYTNIYNKKIHEINYELLKKGEIHGLSHILRASLYTLIICIYEQVNIDYLNIIFDCIFYHDIGRVNDIDDDNHGLNAISKLSFLEKDYSIEELNIIKFVIACHCLEDDNTENFINMFKISDKDKAYKILSIIKDADALDRVREYPYLDIKYLRLDSSKRIVSFSYELYETFYMIGGVYSD